MSTRNERGFLALFVALFAWALVERFGARPAGADASQNAVSTGAVVLMSAAPLARRPPMRWAPTGLSAVALLAYFVIR